MDSLCRCLQYQDQAVVKSTWLCDGNFYADNMDSLCLSNLLVYNMLFQNIIKILGEYVNCIHKLASSLAKFA